MMGCFSHDALHLQWGQGWNLGSRETGEGAGPAHAAPSRREGLQRLREAVGPSAKASATLGLGKEGSGCGVPSATVPVRGLPSTWDVSA